MRFPRTPVASPLASLGALGGWVIRGGGKAPPSAAGGLAEFILSEAEGAGMTFVDSTRSLYMIDVV